MRLDGKTAIVTGGGSGFGAGIARHFRAEGARVMVADLNAEAAEAMAGRDRLRLDVAGRRPRRGVAEIAKAAAGRFGQLDILVNNAGITHLPQALEDVPEDEFDRVLRVNAKSVYLTARASVPR